MEDLFELVAALAIAAIGIIAKINKNKKKAADKPTPAEVIESAAKASERSIEPPRPAEPAKPITEAQKLISRQNIENAIAAFSELIEAESESKKAARPSRAESAPRPAKRKKKPAPGESPVDVHGCIGGSMPNHSAEGESQREHAAHERERREHLAAEAAVRAESLRKPTAADLRKAVVMSEILDKPVGLRRRI